MLAGSRAASFLAEKLPSNYRVILIDRQSHFNHLYKFQRHAVVPGHSHKAFVPFTNLLHAPVLSEDQCPAPTKESQKKIHHVVVQASVLNITPSHIEVDSDLCEIPGLSEPELKIDASLAPSGKGKVCCCMAEGGKGCTDPSQQKRCAGTRIPYEYLVYVCFLFCLCEHRLTGMLLTGSRVSSTETYQDRRHYQDRWDGLPQAATRFDRSQHERSCDWRWCTRGAVCDRVSRTYPVRGSHSEEARFSIKSYYPDKVSLFSAIDAHASLNVLCASSESHAHSLPG